MQSDLSVVVCFVYKALPFNLCQFRVHEFDSQLDAMLRGLASVVPIYVLTLFSWSEFERMVCGVPSVDIDLLQRMTVYEGVTPNDPHIQRMLCAMGRDSPLSMLLCAFSLIQWCSVLDNAARTIQRVRSPELLEVRMGAEQTATQRRGVRLDEIQVASSKSSS